jgi:hypothetical protein
MSNTCADAVRTLAPSEPAVAITACYDYQLLLQARNAMVLAATGGSDFATMVDNLTRNAGHEYVSKTGDSGPHASNLRIEVDQTILMYSNCPLAPPVTIRNQCARVPVVNISTTALIARSRKQLMKTARLLSRCVKGKKGMHTRFHRDCCPSGLEKIGSYSERAARMNPRQISAGVSLISESFSI